MRDIEKSDLLDKLEKLWALRKEREKAGEYEIILDSILKDLVDIVSGEARAVTIFPMQKEKENAD